METVRGNMDITAIRGDGMENMVTEDMLPIVGASMLGTTIGWYDIYLYGFFSVTIFPAIFYPRLDPVAGIIALFTTNLVGFAARPLGGALFGWFGDRVGRRSTLVSTLLLMGGSTTLMGVLPGYATIGIAAPLLLALLRFLQGVGVGGEWGGAVLLPLEYGNKRQRGFWASWPQAGVPLALAITALLILFFERLYPDTVFAAVGWRMPFLLGALLVLVGLYIRLRIPETPPFTRLKEECRESKAPLMEAFRYNWREILFSALVRSGEQAPFYIFTFFALSYGTVTLRLDASLLYIGLVLAAGISLVTMPTFAAISDRVGRKRWCLLGNLAMGLYAYPYFLLLNTRNPALVILAIALSLGLCHAWVYGLQAALIAEQFPTRYRYTASSLGYQLASLTAGGPAPIIATFLLANYAHILPGSTAFALIAAYLIAMSLVSLVSVLPLKEYAGKTLLSDDLR